MTLAEVGQAGRAGERELRRAVRELEIALPPVDSAQDEEWVVARTDDGWRRIRLHDYDEVFKVPGLYEKWLYETLRCQSPQKIADLMARALLREGASAEDCVTLDLGAGNGCVGEELEGIGLTRLVGVDLIDEARAAAERDRPGLYADYVVCDLTDLSPGQAARLRAHAFNTLVCVAALGFGDIPPLAFARAFNLISDGGWIAFNIKSGFLDDAGGSPFARLIGRMIAQGILEPMLQEAYTHRLNPLGEQLEYVAIIGRKLGAIPEGWTPAPGPTGSPPRTR